MSDLTAALPGLGFVGLAVSLIAAFGRDPQADQHDLSDYHEAAPVNPAPRSLRHYEALDSRPIPATMRVRYDFDISPEPTDDILPPAPEGMNAGSPIYAATLFHTWRGGETPADTAARYLRELAAEQVTR